MKTTMIVNRMNDWFVFDDVNNDPFYLSILLLEKLSNRPKKGLKYDRLVLINELTKHKSVTGLETLDKALIILTSRSLVEIKDNKNKLETTIYINDKGKKVLKDFRKEISHVS